MTYCDKCGNPEWGCSCEEDEKKLKEDIQKQISLQEMRKKHPGFKDVDYETGAMLGVDFPYVPGDPFW